MNFVSLKCPNCNSSLEIENDIDSFFCKYCGYHIILENPNKEVLKAKIDIKRMEHKERLADKKYAHERYKLEAERKEGNIGLTVGLLMMGISFFVILFMGIYSNFAVNKQEEKLETILAEVLIDIDSGNYEAAAIKANTLYWDSSWSNEEKAKWNSTRKAIIKQIEEAKEKENSSSEEVGGWFNWFD